MTTERDDDDTNSDFDCDCPRAVGIRFRPVGDRRYYHHTLCQYCLAAPVSTDEPNGELCGHCKGLSDAGRMICSRNTDRLVPGPCGDVRDGHPSARWWYEGETGDGGDSFCDWCVAYTDW